jgi:hypothetical protein
MTLLESQYGTYYAVSKGTDGNIPQEFGFKLTQEHMMRKSNAEVLAHIYNIARCFFQAK